jgi:hypothetical protein
MEKTDAMILDYLLATCAELALIATKSELPVIAYLLKIAALEAEQMVIAAEPEREPPVHPLWPPGTARAAN